MANTHIWLCEAYCCTCFYCAWISITHSTGDNRTKTHNLIANAYLEWKIDSVTNLVFRPQYRYNANARRGSGYQESWSDETLLNERNSSSLYDNDLYNLTFMLQVNRKFSRKGRNLSLKLDYGTNASSSDRESFSNTHYFKNDTEKSVPFSTYSKFPISSRFF